MQDPSTHPGFYGLNIYKCRLAIDPADSPPTEMCAPTNRVFGHYHVRMVSVCL